MDPFDPLILLEVRSYQDLLVLLPKKCSQFVVLDRPFAVICSVPRFLANQATVGSGNKLGRRCE